ncbi:bacteriocin-processing peptidase. Cysteine peptidase. MEROPS family C39 [Pedobacter suwonensis]|uniref:Bacteriocin-processing peptidase. Cysteine peptidase. MEROPS family C39 n=1 Tax=Pedobacter suwonensis TaxID=332999 RepID=A0A1I0T9N3_9SPHI|nr:peptidase domain-containing ABC transporter [Pedobacter suwonensis]SFA48498.1 bacteriocin-processing peptidase. Cysteine peptidase. MEROPS family C39 [Pedobacter suwonensis]
MRKKFTIYIQPDQMDCGPTCLRMIAKYYGRNYSLQRLREISGINRAGVSFLGISEAAEKIGFRCNGVRIDLKKLSEVELPCILHWSQNHFVVLIRVNKSTYRGKSYLIADPAKGIVQFNEPEFIRYWRSNKFSENKEGVALLISPTPEFFLNDDDEVKQLNFAYMAKYLMPYKGLIIQLFIGLGVGSMLQLILPFLTQSLVDIGINTRNLNFIYVVVIAQTMLFLGRMSVDFIRSWILLHMSTRINISILTDFLIKLLKLPMEFFETKMPGDIMQRMSDQGRIQNFLTGSSLNTIFSLFNLVVFAFVLLYYNSSIFLIFAISSFIYGMWVVFFLKKRRELDFKRFDISSENQNNIVQLIGGIQEIKLNNCEQQKRWEWERIQASLFKFSIKSLALGQYQQFGTFFINEGKNILITLMVTKSVVDGQLTLGAMMAVQYIVGQLNSPIEQLFTFLQSYQDAKISMERLSEIHELKDEEPFEMKFLSELPSDKGIALHNITFTYPGAGNEPVLKDIHINFPEGKTTAIVGMSGSGKTTILKLLLRFYAPQIGDIKVGNNYLQHIGYRFWRGCCGVVMQDGFIFSDTIAKNIAVGDDYPDMAKLQHALHLANIHDFVNNLPLGLNTIIGLSGNGISQGQKQRILIARAVYKDPDYIFFDEATNALDANNEIVIMQNLENFFKGRTVLVVAHRLSTVKNADNIIVLDKGKVVEQGTHHELTDARGQYYELVKNQLELEI